MTRAKMQSMTWEEVRLTAVTAQALRMRDKHTPALLLLLPLSSLLLLPLSLLLLLALQTQMLNSPTST